METAVTAMIIKDLTAIISTVAAQISLIAMFGRLPLNGIALCQIVIFINRDEIGAVHRIKSRLYKPIHRISVPASIRLALATAVKMWGPVITQEFKENLLTALGKTGLPKS